VDVDLGAHKQEDLLIDPKRESLTLIQKIVSEDETYVSELSG